MKDFCILIDHRIATDIPPYATSSSSIVKYLISCVWTSNAYKTVLNSPSVVISEIDRLYNGDTLSVSLYLKITLTNRHYTLACMLEWNTPLHIIEAYYLKNRPITNTPTKRSIK
jgi:hypothetical protein